MLFRSLLHILRGAFTRSLDAEAAAALTRMTYGVTCFALLFNVTGTVLGGIWADQSWGRFWGWDPKENGALLIVIWNALILHARWGGLVRARGLMNLAIFGNIVTAFSWFGVNMLGVGLHSYGFMDAAFKWLMMFNASQLFLIALGALLTWSLVERSIATRRLVPGVAAIGEIRRQRHRGPPVLLVLPGLRRRAPNAQGRSGGAKHGPRTPQFANRRLLKIDKKLTVDTMIHSHVNALD